MPDIVFYHLMRRSLVETLHFLGERCLARNWRVLVLTDTDTKADELDQELWLVGETGFLPHGRDNDDFAADQPILITSEDKGLIPTDVRIHVGRFDLYDDEKPQRLIYLFQDKDEEAKEKARTLWRDAASRKLPLAYWQEQQNGGFAELTQGKT